MTKDNLNISVGKKGMNRDTHPMNLSESEYTIAFNANVEEESGNGYPMLQNEHSNILCSKFKDGYKVIGFKNDLNEDKTYYFLTNPTTGLSEIGYISNIQNLTTVTDLEANCGCNIVRILDTPLEEQEQIETCTYNTIISDCIGNNCLNFSVNHPIKDGNIQLKDEKCGKRLYWTDGYNPPRYLDLSNMEQYYYEGIKTCLEDTLEATCLDCDKLRIFPYYEKPCIQPVSIQYGGNLRAGVYEFLIAYCDKTGNEITQYFSITNPVSIFDEHNTILDQTQLDYRTNFGIRLEVSDLDDKFGYYKVAVIQRADVDGATSYFIEGIHPTTDKTILYYSEQEKQRTTLNTLLAVKPLYTKAGIMTSSNGYLFQADLTAEKEYNLQPVFNIAGAFLRWQTSKGKEDLYKDGVNNSLYRGYMRDEVYPFSIRFYTTDGFETANFILPNRPPSASDLQIVNNKDVQSINEFVPNCADNGRIYRWQYYNTASVLGTCENSEPNPDIDLSCTPVPYEYGKFGYWQSEETYPDNDELYNSSNLIINKNKIPNSIRVEFEEYFSEGENEDNYVLKSNLDLKCQPIRHYRFPDSCVSPFMNEEDLGRFKDSYIYPIGVTIDMEVLNSFLDIAVDNNLITQEQRDKLDKFEIFRGDRTLHKGVIAKGLAYDMYKYNESDTQTDILYSNYPYNDLGEDDLHYTNKDRNALIQHPYGGTSNNRFTFHSPDMHFHKPTLPSEVKLEGYQFGDSRGQFVQVEGHSKWVILSKQAYSIATTLAVTEAVFELMIKYGDFQVQNAIAGDRVTDGYYKGKVKTKTDLTTQGSYGVVTGEFTVGTGTIQTSPGSGSIKGEESSNHDNYGDNLTINNGIKETPLTPGTNPTVTGDGLRYAEADVNVDRVSFFERALVYAGMLNNTFSKIGQYRYEWLKIFKENGQPENFAFYYVSEGLYNKFLCNGDEGNMIRGLAAKKYLKPGRYRVNETHATDALKINHVNRESAVFMSFGEGHNINYNTSYIGHDNSRFESSDIGVGNGIELDLGDSDDNGNQLFNFTYDSRSPEVTANIASPYMSMKDYLPGQYGEIDSIKWIPTGYCGSLETAGNCLTIYGGDIFISRFSLKRKLPLFLVTALDLADLTPFNYYPYRNIAHTKYYVDYDVTEMNVLGNLGSNILDTIASIASLGILGQAMPQFKSYYELDNEFEKGFYVRPPSKFYLYYYGIPQFLVESEINCNYRYARRELHENFYPNVGDYVDWTQEKTGVSIKKDNEYYYNDTYSKNTTMVGTRTLPSTYSKKLYDCLYDAPNGVIYSLQDSSEQDINDPWLVYKPLDFYQFPTSSGRLIDLKDIESSQIIGRFEHQLILFNAIDQLKDRLSPTNQELGTGGIFASRPLEFKKTDLGYAGTQHKVMVSCEFGHFWADANRGQVFQVDQNGKDLKEITIGLRNWFKEHLPFKIMRGGITNLTITDLDNHFKGLGLTMGWDSRYKRVFLTKKDYIVKPNYINKLEYRDGEFYLFNTIVPLTNREVFEDASFTLAYNPILQTWISYYSFKPDYYISHHNYFQTGLNYSVDSNETGIWSHLLSNKSFQVFYGKRYGWLIELPIKEGYTNKILSSVEYWLDSRRYHNEYDYAENLHKGFNKAYIYNETNNSGLLNLVRSEKNNLYQKLQYPKFTNNGMDILTTEKDKKWTFNTFFNRTRNENNNVPIWNYDNNAIDKVINISSLNYQQKFLDRLRGDYFSVRFIQDEESRYKNIFKWFVGKEKLY